MKISKQWLIRLATFVLVPFLSTDLLGASKWANELLCKRLSNGTYGIESRDGVPLADLPWNRRWNTSLTDCERIIDRAEDNLICGVTSFGFRPTPIGLYLKKGRHWYRYDELVNKDKGPAALGTGEAYEKDLEECLTEVKLNNSGASVCMKNDPRETYGKYYVTEVHLYYGATGKQFSTLDECWRD